MLDIDDIADVVAGAIREATAPLIERNAALDARNADLEARIAALEARELPGAIQGEPGRDGADCDVEAVERMIEERFAALPAPQPGQPGEPGADGKDVDMEAVAALISEAAERAVAALPPAEPGVPGKDGRDVDMAEVKRFIADEVAVAVSTLPPAEKGSDGKDGIGLADALIDKDGRLVITMTDGRTKELGVVIGKDGRDGENGVAGETFTLDDFDIIPLDDGRSFKFCFTRGGAMHSFEFSFPVVLDRGVWREGGAYTKGDAVSWAGSLWIAQRDAPGKPDTADGGWRLSVKRGRDGKDAK